VSPRFYLIVIALLVVAAGVVVLVRNRSLDDEILASIAVLGGIAIAIVAVRNGTGHEETKS
jgi:hypothetical protein